MVVDACLCAHPEAEKKIGAGQDVPVATTPSTTLGAMVMRVGGTCEDFSYRKCVEILPGYSHPVRPPAGAAAGAAAGRPRRPRRTRRGEERQGGRSVAESRRPMRRRATTQTPRRFMLRVVQTSAPSISRHLSVRRPTAHPYHARRSFRSPLYPALGSRRSAAPSPTTRSSFVRASSSFAPDQRGRPERRVRHPRRRRERSEPLRGGPVPPPVRASTALHGIAPARAALRRRRVARAAPAAGRAGRRAAGGRRGLPTRRGADRALGRRRAVRRVVVRADASRATRRHPRRGSTPPRPRG